MPSNPQPQNGQQIQVKINEEVLKGVYSNMVQIGHTQEEFVLDFMNILPPQGVLASRVILTPAHVKRIVAALQENIKRYEQQFSPIPESSGPPQPNYGFRTD